MSVRSADGSWRGSHRLLGLPFLIGVLLVLALELLLYVLIRLFVFLYELVLARLYFPAHKHQLLQSTSYQEYRARALALDRASGRERWKLRPESSFYNHAALQRISRELGQAILTRDGDKIEQLLLEEVFHPHRVLVGLGNRELYSQSFVGTKYCLEEFVSKVVEAVAAIQRLPWPTAKKLDALEKASRSYGRTALCLSGGGTMGYFHFGVIKALRDLGLLPSVLSGTSAGSLVAGIVCVRTDEELDAVLSPSFAANLNPFEEGIFTLLRRFLTKGSAFDKELVCRKSREVLMGDMTFLEAYKRTGRTLNITVTVKHKHATPVVLNHVTTPNVVIWTAVVASSSIPGLWDSVMLKSKSDSGQIEEYRGFGVSWCDGSIKNDIPLKELSEYFNVTFVIVSQTNPHIIPFFYRSRGSPGEPSPQHFGSNLRGGFLIASAETLLKLDMKKWLRLIKQLDILPQIRGYDIRSLWLQKFDGDITIHLKMNWTTLWSYFRMASDPSPSDFDKYLHEGQLLTWPKISMIHNHLILEKMLDQISETIRKEALD